MCNLTIEQTYEVIGKGIIKSMAYKYARKYFCEVEELEAEGNLEFCKCFPKHNPERASFSTFLYMRLENRFFKYCQNERNRYAKEIPLCPQTKNIAFSLKPDFSQEFALTEKQAELLDYALNHHRGRNTYPTINSISKYFKANGWKRATINETLYDLKKMAFDI